MFLCLKSIKAACLGHFLGPISMRPPCTWIKMHFFTPPPTPAHLSCAYFIISSATSSQERWGWQESPPPWHSHTLSIFVNELVAHIFKIGTFPMKTWIDIFVWALGSPSCPAPGNESLAMSQGLHTPRSPPSLCLLSSNLSITPSAFTECNLLR